MRIALNGWFADQPGTGSGQYCLSLLRAWAEQALGHEFLLVVPQALRLPELRGLRLSVVVQHAVVRQPDLRKVLFEQVTFPRACRRRRADVALVPYWGSPLWTPVRTLVTVHDLIPRLLPAYRGGPLVRLYTALASAAARRAALVLTDSLASKADIEQNLGLRPDQVRCIYLAAGEQFRPEEDPSDRQIRSGYGLVSAGATSPLRYILYLAGHDVRKNVAGLLEAFAVMARADDEATLVVGGALPTATRQTAPLRGRSPLVDPRPLTQSLGLGERVRFIGWVEEQHRPALYRGAACAVFPSRYEGFGLPVLEALACGTPLVCSNASSLPELLGDAGFALDPDDIRGFAGAMLACLADESLAADLRRRGPVQAGRFRWSRTASETLEAMEGILE